MSKKRVRRRRDTAADAMHACQLLKAFSPFANMQTIRLWYRPLMIKLGMISHQAFEEVDMQLRYHVQKGNPEIVYNLLCYGGDPLYYGEDIYTTLYLAEYIGNRSVIDLLLKSLSPDGFYLNLSGNPFRFPWDKKR